MFLIFCCVSYLVFCVFYGFKDINLKKKKLVSLKNIKMELLLPR